ncbi:MAG: hypothetical protein ACLP7P_08535 [Rhodomicrobium sp.]
MAKKPQQETAKDDRITIRLTPELRKALNDLRRKEDDIPTPVEMVRRLIERAAHGK